MRQISNSTLGNLQAFFLGLPDNVKLRLEMDTLLRDLSFGLEVTALQHQLDYLVNMIRRQAATPEIRILAKKIVRESLQRHTFWENKILWQRVMNKNKELLRAKHKWKKSTVKTEALLPGNLAAKFRDIKKWEINHFWQIEKLIVVRYSFG